VASDSSRRDYIYATWEFDSVARRSALGFWGFLVQTVLVAIVLVIYSFKDVQTKFTMSLLLVAIVPVQIGFWILWFFQARRLQHHLTFLLNVTADEEHFTLPRISPVNSKYAPQIAIVIAFQVLASLYVALNIS